MTHTHILGHSKFQSANLYRNYIWDAMKPEIVLLQILNQSGDHCLAFYHLNYC